MTWDQIIDAAEQTGTTVDVTGARYEGYMVWINSLVASAGGKVLEDPAAGKDATPTLDTDAGRQGGRDHPHGGRNVAAPGLSTAIEEDARAAFQSDTGRLHGQLALRLRRGPRRAVEDGSLDQAVVDDIGWARVPRVDEGTESAPPLGGINIGIGAFSDHPDQAVDAVNCITSEESQTAYMLGEGNPAARPRCSTTPRSSRRSRWRT